MMVGVVPVGMFPEIMVVTPPAIVMDVDPDAEFEPLVLSPVFVVVVVVVVAVVAVVEPVVVDPPPVAVVPPVPPVPVGELGPILGVITGTGVPF